jgi:hypothetical protein
MSRPSTPRPPRTRIAADSRTVVYGAAVLTLTVGVAAFCVSWSGLVAMAAFAGVPEAWRPCVPVLVDGALLAQTAVLMVLKERQESVRATYAGLAGYTLLSVVTNGAHAWDAGGSTGGYRAIIGLALAAGAPVGVLVATHALAAVAISPAPVRRPAPASAPLPDVAPAAPRAATPPQQRPARSAPARTPTPAGVGARQEALRLAGEGLSQRAIAEAVGASKSSVARWLVAEAVTV